MAQSDQAAFRRALLDAEAQMDEIFGSLARDIGQVVLNAAGPDGTVPVERLPQVQAQARRLVDRVFVDASGKAFNEETHEPTSPYGRIVAQGQQAMIELAFQRQARILQQHLPEDVQRAMAARQVTRDV